MREQIFSTILHAKHVQAMMTSTTANNLRWDWDTPATRLLVRPTLSGEVMTLTDIPPLASVGFLGRAEIRQQK
jgi:hypothetical protein